LLFMATKIVLYFSSATSQLIVKKATQSFKFLLDKKKVQYEEVDLSQMPKDERDAVYLAANTRTIPMLFVDGKYIGDYETCQYLEEDESKKESLVVLKYAILKFLEIISSHPVLKKFVPGETTNSLVKPIIKMMKDYIQKVKETEELLKKNRR